MECVAFEHSELHGIPKVNIISKIEMDVYRSMLS